MVPIIIGIVVSILVLIFLVAVIIFHCFKSKKTEKGGDDDINSDIPRSDQAIMKDL